LSGLRLDTRTQRLGGNSRVEVLEVPKRPEGVRRRRRKAEGVTQGRRDISQL